MNDLIHAAADLLSNADHGVVLTGAGISTPSGIPDFRSQDSGMWHSVDPFEVASIVGFSANPHRFFEWIRPVARLLTTTEPNPAHYAIAQMERLGLIDAVITQNIDTLHSKAGSQTVHEVHGSIRTGTCVSCYTTYPAEMFLDRFLETGQIPRCPDCLTIIKPEVILFSEQLPYATLQAAQKAVRECDVMLVAGSSLKVDPVAGMPQIALAHGAEVIMVNYGHTYMDSDASIVIHDDVAAVLPAILAVAREKQAAH